MLKPYSDKATLTSSLTQPAALQLLLFVDDRPSYKDNIEQIKLYLGELHHNYHFHLEVIPIGKQPHLVEHFRLITTPALVKIYPEPKHTLAGSDILAQLKRWWLHWKPLPKEKEIGKQEENLPINYSSENLSLKYSAELMKMSDEIFRLKKEKEELLELLKFKDQIVAMLAHDLRSPLTAASIAVETIELAQHHHEPERYLELKSQLNKQIKNQFQIMNRMITDILQASKSMSAKLRVDAQELNLPSLCHEIITAFTPRFPAKRQVFKQDIPQDIPSVYADRELIRQVIVNLLDNAVKYTPEEGTISLCVLHRTSQNIQVSVCDTGLGIPEEKRETIFQGHFRLKRDESKDGYGLGLYLCRQVVCAHYGQIWVDSSLNQGSSFHFTLPVYRQI